MGATSFDGPLFSYGDLGNLISSVSSGTVIEPDPNQDRGPSMLFAGYGMPDVRFSFLKDQVEGYTGKVPIFLAEGTVVEVDTIPITASNNLIVTAANTTQNTAMSLVATNTTGRTVSVPIIPLTGIVNSGSVVQPGIALDWGFSFLNITSGSKNATVADSTMFYAGMPLVVPAAGAASGVATPLYTSVASITDATTIVLNDAPLQSLNPIAVGTGNIWGPSENGYPVPTAHAPYLPMGPGWFPDPRQMLGRTLRVVCNSASGTGGVFTVVGYDVFGQAMSEAITITPGTATTAWGAKAFKYITSVTPNFTDASFTYSVGTADMFGFTLRTDECENTTIWWAGLLNTATTGFTAGVTTSPALTTTGDVRGLIQTTTASGSGTGIGTTATNGSVSALALTGRRLTIKGALRTWQQLNARLVAPQWQVGVVQA
jgi:hypothetical protein